jgi:hypothetical protein
MDTELVVEKSATVLTQLITGKGVGRCGFHSVAGTAPTALNQCFGFLLEKVQDRNLRIYKPFTSADICRGKKKTKRNVSNAFIIQKWYQIYVVAVYILWFLLLVIFR